MFEQSGWRIGSLLGVEISVSTGFLFIVVINAILNDLYTALVFSIALFISLVIHEMGHALVAKRYKLRPSVLLHGFGGLCFHDQARTDGQDAFIVVMGPIAQMLAGGLVFGLSTLATLPKVPTDIATYFVVISLFWGALNLFLPIYPLDGGKLFHLILRRFLQADAALTWALRVSIGVSIPLGLLAIANGWYIGGFLVAFIVMDNFAALKGASSVEARPARTKDSGMVSEMLADAQKSFDEGDFREAYRLCHQVRSLGDGMSEKSEARMWELLALSTVEIGEYDEAKAWLKRAPQTERIRAATAQLPQS